MSPKRNSGIRGKGEGSVYQRASDGMWCGSVELPLGDDGRRRRKVVSAKTKPRALQKLREAQAELHEHGDIAATTAGLTLEKWMGYWLDEVCDVRPKALESYRAVARNHIIPELGRVPLAKLSPDHVRQLKRRFANMPKDPKVRALPKDQWPEGTEMLSSTYALNAYAILSKALEDARREGKVRTNPCSLVDPPKRRVARQHALTVPEAVKLLGYCATIPDGPLWATYLLTGARRGELLGLERDRAAVVVDGHEVIDLSWQMQRIADIGTAQPDYEYRPVKGKLYLTRPKSKAGWRVIPLVEPLRSIMVLALEAAPEGSPLVFTEDGRPWNPDRATRRWKAVLKAAGLPDDVVLHGARHTVVDLLSKAGVSEGLKQEIVGHSSRAMTEAYRTKGDIPQLEAAMLKMSGLLAGSPQAEAEPES